MHYLPRPVLVMALVLSFVLPGVSSAEETPVATEATQVKNSPVTLDPWKSFSPPPDNVYDWIQLVSGEWLKGTLKAMYNYELEFDSDELDLLTLDWDDVRQIRSADYQSLYIEQAGNKPVTVVGIVEMVGNTVTVTANGETQTFQRRDIISIAEGSERELDLWTGEFSLGANASSGNSDLVDLNILANAKRRSASSRFFLQYLGNFSRTEGVETSNNHRVTTFYDIFTSSRFFWRTVAAEYYRDTFRNISGQFSMGTAVGYDLVRTSKTEWSVLAGFGGLQTRYVSVEPGDDITSSSPVLLLGTRLDTDITKRIEYIFDFNAQFVNKEAGGYIQHMLTTLSTDLNDNLDLDISLVWDRIAEPQPRDDGTTPDKNDFQLIIAISYEI